MLQEIKTEAKNTTTIKINTSLFIITSFCLMNISLLLFSRYKPQEIHIGSVDDDLLLVFTQIAAI